MSQGGDDINQFMTCDEHEFLEIMSLVGMASKPLHVRRFQRTLTEFSNDPDAFNLLAVQQIGVPPLGPFTGPSSSVAPNPAAALQFLLSSQGLAAASFAAAAALPTTSHSFGNASPRGTSQIHVSAAAINRSASSSESLHDLTAAVVTTSSSVGATANVMAGDFLTSLVSGSQTSTMPPNANYQGNEITCPSASSTSVSTLINTSSHSSTSSFPRHSPSSPPGSVVDNTCDFEQLGATSTTETPVLTDAQICKLAQCSIRLIEQMPQFEPKMMQNKKKISRELLEVMQLPRESPLRLPKYRKYSAIYGRFDAKRKPDKPLTLHEVSVNEAAAQLCLRQPALLTRRDELFPLARQVVKDAGYNYVKGIKRSDAEIRRRLAVPPDSSYTSDPSQSPQSSISAGSPAPDDFAADSGSETIVSAKDDSGPSRKRRFQDSPPESHNNEPTLTSSTSSLPSNEKWANPKLEPDDNEADG